MSGRLERAMPEPAQFHQQRATLRKDGYRFWFGEENTLGENGVRTEHLPAGGPACEGDDLLLGWPRMKNWWE